MSNEIIESNSWLIYKIARSYSEYYNIEDLFQVGSIGLLKAYKNYDKNSNVKLPPDSLRFQRASSVAAVAIKKYNNDETVSAAALMPSYLRLSQAERELIAKNKGEKK